MSLLRVVVIPLTLVLLTADVSADVVVEHFDHPIQNDTTGFVGGGGITYRMTTTGTFGALGDLTVLTWSDGFQSGAGIRDDGGNHVGFLDTSSQSGLGSTVLEFVGIADLPGFGDTGPGGPFGQFFSVPQNVDSASGSIDLRVASGTNATQVRLLATDVFDNEVATNLFTLTGSFQTFGFVDSDFINQVQGVTFDPTQVINLGIEFFATTTGAGSIDAMRFEVDAINLVTVPEPTALATVMATLATMICWRYTRRLKSSATPLS